MVSLDLDCFSAWWTAAFCFSTFLPLSAHWHFAHNQIKAADLSFQICLHQFCSLAGTYIIEEAGDGGGIQSSELHLTDSVGFLNSKFSISSFFLFFVCLIDLCFAAFSYFNVLCYWFITEFWLFLYHFGIDMKLRIISFGLNL